MPGKIHSTPETTDDLDDLNSPLELINFTEDRETLIKKLFHLSLRFKNARELIIFLYSELRDTQASAAEISPDKRFVLLPDAELVPTGWFLADGTNGTLDLSTAAPTGTKYIQLIGS